MERFFTRPWLKALSGLFINFSAAWFALIFITPIFTKVSSSEATFTLTRDFIYGMLFLIATVKIEEKLENERYP
ncbi:MAG: hypothetical protein HY427_02275 [Candidatus Levybacteria bacterium]|nr:hypothetical protein [Candidatus Levybacteria bacterium]